MALKYSSFAEASVTANTNNTIWVFWAQGRDHMPALVKQCVEQIDRMKGEFRLVVLDTDSYKQYVTLPNVVLRKLAEGKMTLTHFQIFAFCPIAEIWWMVDGCHNLPCASNRQAKFSVFHKDRISAAVY